MPRVAIYARVSTDEQNVETQLLPLREYAKTVSEDEVREFVDEGVSGSKTSRPALDRLMKDVRRKRVSALIVARFDRLSRSVLHLLQTLEEFRARGVRVVSLAEGFDSGTPQGRMMIAMVGVFAEFERELIRERVLAGLARRRAQGGSLGRPVTLDHDEIRRLRGEGLSMTKIAKEAGCSLASVSRVLEEKSHEVQEG